MNETDCIKYNVKSAKMQFLLVWHSISLIVFIKGWMIKLQKKINSSVTLAYRSVRTIAVGFGDLSKFWRFCAPKRAC